MNGRGSNRLTDELDRGAHRFEQLGGSDLSLEQVLGRARGIRRRRRAGMALAAAVLAAVAVPVGLSMGSPQARLAPPATTTQPVRQIGLGDLPMGPEPSTGWVAGHTWHSPSGRVLAINAQVGDVRSIAPTTGGAVVSVARSDGTLWAWFLHDDGRFEELGSPIEGGLTRSPEGHLVAFATGSTSTEVVQAGHRIVLPDVRGLFGKVVAVTGENCEQHGDCVAYVATEGTDSAATVQNRLPSTWRTGWLTPSALGSERLGRRMQTLADVAPDGRVAGIVSRTGTGSCSEVEDPGGRRVWGTCGARFVAFSPDGTRLLGTSAYGDGLGDTQLTVFDAATGGKVVDLHTLRGVVISQMVWEDDTHVLASVMRGGRAAVLRIGLDGRPEYAVPPVPAPADTNPLLLPVS